MNVARLLEPALGERSDRAALIERRGGRDLVTSYRALDLLAGRAAGALAAAGGGGGDPVLFFAPPSRELYAALVGAFRIGAVAMFVEPSAGRDTLDGACALLPPRAFVGSAKAQLLRLASDAVRSLPAHFAPAGWLPFTRGLFASQPLTAPAAERSDDAPALVTFTSGSTGQPKGAIRTHGILRAQLELLADVVLGPPDEAVLVALPIVVLLGLARGATVVLPDADLRRPGAIRPAPVLAQIDRHRVGRIVAAPAFLSRLCDGAEQGAGSIARARAVVTGGGPVFPDLMDRVTDAAPGATLRMVYGSTEAEPIAHLDAVELDAADRRAMREGGGLPAGRPARGPRVAVIRSVEGRPLGELDAAAFARLRVPVGEPGEIVAAGPHVVRGYVRGIGDAETKFRVEGEVWHRTGDVGRIDATGRLWLLGRQAAVVPDERGTLYPFAVECAARELAGGRRTALLGRVLAVEGGDAETLERVHAGLAWAQLDAIHGVRRIPLDRRHNAKVDYGALAALLGPPPERRA